VFNFCSSLVIKKKNTSKKSNLHYTRLIPFRVSRVSGAYLRGFAPRPTQLRLQRWRVVGNVWEIWSARYLNCIPPAPILFHPITGSSGVSAPKVKTMASHQEL